jgi:hypothetical protein
MTYSTLATLLAAHDDFAPTSAEITAWNTATAFDASDLVVTKAGLFGADLTSFNADCTAAGATVCTPADYADYTGWAVGVNWQPDSTTPPSDGDIRGLGFNGLMEYVEVTFVATASTAYTIESGTLTSKASATTPVDGTDVTLAAALDGFDAWSGAPVTDSTM